jgi:hypothetical protein
MRTPGEVADCREVTEAGDGLVGDSTGVACCARSGVPQRTRVRKAAAGVDKREFAMGTAPFRLAGSALCLLAGTCPAKAS